VLAWQPGVSHAAVRTWGVGKRLPPIGAFAKIEEPTGTSAKERVAWDNRSPEQD
jgi:hypothetical protein